MRVSYTPVHYVYPSWTRDSNGRNQANHARNEQQTEISCSRPARQQAPKLIYN
jgi:hypothetical protein